MCECKEENGKEIICAGCKSEMIDLSGNKFGWQSHPADVEKYAWDAIMDQVIDNEDYLEADPYYPIN